MKNAILSFFFVKIIYENFGGFIYENKVIIEISVLRRGAVFDDLCFFGSYLMII